MSTVNSVVAIYETQQQAEHAVKELQEAGVDMKNLSVVARDTHTDEHAVGYYDAGECTERQGKAGAFWRGFGGLLPGSGLFFIPGQEPILVAGSLVAWITAGRKDADVVGRASAIKSGLVNIGISRDSVLKYEVALKTDKLLLVMHGTQDAVINARDILARTKVTSYTVHGETVLVRQR